MRQSIFFKIFAGYMILTIALCGLIVFTSYYIIRNSHTETKAQDLTDLATALKTEVTPFLESQRTKALDNFTKELGRTIHTRITIVAHDGKVLADSEEDPSRMENHQTRPEIAQAMNGSTGKFLRVSETLRQEMLYIAIPVMKNDRVFYVLRVSKFLKELSSTTKELLEKMIVIALATTILALVFAFLFSRNIALPVRELRAAFKKMTDRNFNVRVFLKSHDELKELGDSFNKMVSETEGLFQELSRQKEELDSIIGSLQEGILVLDKDERVLISNSSLETITGKRIQKGNLYWEMIREPGLNELVRRVKTAKMNATDEIGLNGRIFLCSATFLKHKTEITIVFNDITEIKKLEKIKTDFVLNVSHELRTPLTSIKGFVETIEAGELSEENRHFIEIIKRNTDRLINIINDLLLLSELQDTDAKLHVEKFEPAALIQQVLKIFEQRAMTKGLYIRLTVDPNTPAITGDPFKLEQVFINLIDNALKYVEKGGVAISVMQKDGRIVIELQDTGPGIPPEHLPRIFERFYVVDKSRSKKLGGTGLGLSIVKHIILLHNGTITAESKPGQGTTFVITLPA
ncbi:MAG TPA: ATP-binding protein [Syntrophorhabdaceae bacterium]|nr:ATP-binding protein [Syntrophorhabdaceae bacterium]